MSTITSPIFNFLDRSDAERAHQVLHAAGIESALLAPGDELPPGWRRDPTDSSFTIWTAKERLKEATALIQQSWPDPGEFPTCQRCGAKNPTIHLMVIQEGTSLTTHLCETCHSNPC